MSRPIKFRAWNDKQGMEFFNLQRLNLESMPFYNFMIKSGIVMQYTGLKDKNGVEIYESDLLKHFDGEIRIVAYDNNAASFALQRNDERRKFVSGMTDHKDYKIIGNIYEKKSY